jgi:tetraacyldisaccharide 4'-kinase
MWYRERRPPGALRVLAQLFGLGVRLRRAGYRRGLLQRHRVAKPVIVVGNISVGGTGKTPLVIWLCERLGALGLHCGVALRGYGGRAARAAASQLVGPDSDAAVVGDEAMLLARRTSALVAVCRDRVRAAQHLAAAGADVIICDDGLQHLALARDFELAVVDAGRVFGNGYLLPAGPLREPPERLAQLDAVVLNVDGLEEATARTNRAQLLTPFIMRLTGERLWPLSGQGSSIALASLAGRRVHAVAGIGHPERFFARLTAAGLQLIAHPFADHHRYQPHELEFGDDLPLLMTEKDAVKCLRFQTANRWFLPVTASLTDADAAALMERLKAVTVLREHSERGAERATQRRAQ